MARLYHEAITDVADELAVLLTVARLEGEAAVSIVEKARALGKVEAIALAADRVLTLITAEKARAA